MSKKIRSAALASALIVGAAMTGMALSGHDAAVAGRPAPHRSVGTDLGHAANRLSPEAAAAALRKVLSSVGPPTARRTPGSVRPGLRAGHAASPRAGLNQVSFFNWSGYADDNSVGDSYQRVAGDWVQPAITCHSDEDELAVFWVGLDGFSDSTVEQDGTLGFCHMGQKYYFTWWEMYPTNAIQLGGEIAAGDKIAAEVDFTKASSSYTLKVSDGAHPNGAITQHQVCGSTPCQNSSAEWIAETPSNVRGLYPWPDFTTWTLTKAKARTKSTIGTISSFPDDQIAIIGDFLEPLATTSGLNGTGDGFTVSWAYTY